MAHNHIPGSGCCEIEDGDVLYDALDSAHATCLNERVSGSCRLVFKPYSARLDSSTSLQSNEGDSELVLHLPFVSTVRLKSVCVRSAERATPSVCRLYRDRPFLDFDAANAGSSDHEIHLPPSGDPSAELWHPVRQVKFSNVSSLQLHFKGECDESSIFYIGLKGDVLGHRHGPVVAVYESQAQLADHSAREASKPGFGLIE
jgi:hypothetical protein